jgi:hypothetical protein
VNFRREESGVQKKSPGAPGLFASITVEAKYLHRTGANEQELWSVFAEIRVHSLP